MHERVAGLTDRTLGSMIWTSSGVAAEAVLQLIVLMILARLLMPADFGVVSIALVVTGFVAIFGELGLSPALIQRHTLEPAHIRTALTGNVAFAVVTAVALWILSPRVAFFFGVPAVEPMVRLLSLSLVLKAWGSVPSALLHRALRFRAISLVNVLAYLVGFGVVGTSLAAAGFGAWALVAAQLVQALVQGVALHTICPVNHRPGIERRAFRELLAYGGGASVARIANYLALRGDNMIVGRMLGPTALGLYGPAYQLMALPADLFQKVVQSALFPAISRMQTERERMALAYRRGIAVTGLTVLPGSMLAVLLAPELVSAVLGPKWSGVTGPLQILAAGMFFRVGYKVSVVFVKAAGAMKSFALRQIPYPIMVLTFSWIGTRWGIEGVAVGVVAALVVHYVLLTTLGLRVTGVTVRQYITAHGPAALLGTVLLVQAWLAIETGRGAQVPPWANLAIVGLSTGLTVAALLRWMPTQVLGVEGLWFRHSLLAFLGRFRNRTGAMARL